jgi:hypothetical protein
LETTKTEVRSLRRSNVSLRRQVQKLSKGSKRR